MSKRPLDEALMPYSEIARSHIEELAESFNRNSQGRVRVCSAFEFYYESAPNNKVARNEKQLWENIMDKALVNCFDRFRGAIFEKAIEIQTDYLEQNGLLEHEGEIENGFWDIFRANVGPEVEDVVQTPERLNVHMDVVERVSAMNVDHFIQRAKRWKRYAEYPMDANGYWVQDARRQDCP